MLNKSKYYLVLLFISALVTTGNISAEETKQSRQEAFLSTIGYITGAAAVCNLAVKESIELSSGMSIAVSNGHYGDMPTAFGMFFNARQVGALKAATKEVECEKIARMVEKYRNKLLNIKASSLPQAGGTSIAKIK